MKTPITYKFYHSLPVEYDWGDATDNKSVIREFAERLELDRAALMEALNKIANRHVIAGSTGDYREGQLHALTSCRDVSRAALAAARANFPDAE